MPEESSVEELCARAKKAVKQGNLKLARDLYRQAVDEDGNSVDARFGLGTCLFLLGELHSALEQFKTVISLDPRKATAYINIGAIYNRLGQQDRAIDFLRRSLDLDPHRAEAYYNLGIAYRAIGKSDLAIDAYREATRLNPRMADAYFNLGNVLVDTKQYAEAAEAYEQALRVRAHFPKAESALKRVRRVLKALQQQESGKEQPAAAEEASGQAPPEPLPRARPFANDTERVLALEELRLQCENLERDGSALAEFVVGDLLRAIGELAHCLVDRRKSGELPVLLRDYNKLLDELASRRKEIQATADRISELKERFKANAERQ